MFGGASKFGPPFWVDREQNMSEPTLSLSYTLGRSLCQQRYPRPVRPHRGQRRPTRILAGGAKSRLHECVGEAAVSFAFLGHEVEDATHMPRIARLCFTDGHTDEVVIDDPRATRLCHSNRYFRRADQGPAEPPTYLEEPTVDRPGAVRPATTDHATPASTRAFGDERLVPGPGGHNTPDW